MRKIKILVATDEKQGKPKDFCFTANGELILKGEICYTEMRFGSCGCGRSFTGAITRKGTTTAKVELLELNQKMVTKLISASERQAGYGERPDKYYREDARSLLSAAARFKAGTVVEIHNNKMRERK